MSRKNETKYTLLDLLHAGRSVVIVVAVVTATGALIGLAQGVANLVSKLVGGT